MSTQSFRRSGFFRLLIPLLAVVSWPGIAATQDEFSVSPKDFDDAWNRAEVVATLDSLANHAALVEEHPGAQDAQLQFLARSHENDSRYPRRFYTEGRYEPAASVGASADGRDCMDRGIARAVRASPE